MANGKALRSVTGTRAVALQRVTLLHKAGPTERMAGEPGVPPLLISGHLHGFVSCFLSKYLLLQYKQDTKTTPSVT